MKSRYFFIDWSRRIVSASIIAGCASSLAQPAASVTFNNLHPQGDFDFSVATSVFKGNIGGYTSNESDPSQPIYWSGGTAGDVVQLEVLGGARVLAMGDGLAGGDMGLLAPIWTLAPRTYEYLSTESVVAANVNAISQRWAGGQAVPIGGNESLMAVYWDLNDIPTNGVILTPFQEGDVFQAGIRAFGQATADSPGIQAGFYGEGLSFQAALWRGTEASRVNLHPLFATDRQPFSIANAAYGSQQGGYYGAELWDEPTEFLDGGRAVLWNGSAASAEDLHPDDYDVSIINGMASGIQVGTVATEGSPFFNYQAFLWMGNKTDTINLHSYLSPEYAYSFAFAADWISPTELWIVGSAINTLTAREEAILWIYKAQDPSTIPTIPQWGLIIMAVMILATAVMMSRPRQTRS